MQEVDAVKTSSQMVQIEAQLSDYPQIYSDIWRFGLNTALRISDLLSIRMSDVHTLDPDNPALVIIERKTRKPRKLLLNEAALGVIYRRSADQPADTWLFQSTSGVFRKTDPHPISRRAVSKVLESIGKKIKPAVRLNTHSLRKTRGWALYDAGYSIERICRILGHSSPSVTMRYIGLTQADIDQSYTDLVL